MKTVIKVRSRNIKENIRINKNILDELTSTLMDRVNNKLKL